MKTKVLTITFILIGSYLSAQTTFTTLTTPGLDSLWNATASFFDADGDGDQDLIYNGGGLNGLVTKLMINNGSGQFTASTQQFLSVYGGKLLTGDMDGDGDKDMFLTGGDTASITLSMLYTNNGSGVFTQNTNSSIFPMFLGDAELFDSDGDNDLDMIITGASTSLSTVETRLYLNNGTGNFTQAPVSFDSLGYTFSTISVGDVDGDGDKDIFVSGQSYQGLIQNSIKSKLYINNGGNNFTASTQNLNGVAGASEFSDYDNDNDLDLIFVGSDSTNTDISNIYTNNGSGQFTLNPTNPIPGLASPALKLFDADRDGDEDLFVTGVDNVALAFVFNYYDNQNGNFVLVTTVQPFIGVWAATIEAGDIDNDTDLDVYVSGAFSPAFASLYLNMIDAVGLTEFAAGNSIGISPNPIEQNQLNYSVNELQLADAYDLEIKDLLGRTVYSQQNMQNNAGNVSINLAGIQSGTYYLVLRSGTQQYCSKFIISKE